MADGPHCILVGGKRQGQTRGWMETVLDLSFSVSRDQGRFVWE